MLSGQSRAAQAKGYEVRTTYHAEQVDTNSTIVSCSLILVDGVRLTKLIIEEFNLPTKVDKC